MQPLHDAVTNRRLSRRCTAWTSNEPVASIYRPRRDAITLAAGKAGSEPATPIRKGSDLQRLPLRAVPGGETPCKPASTVALQLSGCRFRLATPLFVDACGGSDADILGAVCQFPRRAITQLTRPGLTMSQRDEARGPQVYPSVKLLLSKSIVHFLAPSQHEFLGSLKLAIEDHRAKAKRDAGR